ncbi:hypothetical protein ACFVXQ_00100 [Kitasatospora sp. NPDC058263]
MDTARQRLAELMELTDPATRDAALDELTADALAAAHARVAALPTANQGQLICATREQILDAIITAGGDR